MMVNSLSQHKSIFLRNWINFDPHQFPASAQRPALMRPWRIKGASGFDMSC